MKEPTGMLVSHDIQCAALRQLETALCLYFKGEDYYSVVTLAGASEEVLGKLLKHRNLGDRRKFLRDCGVSEEDVTKLLEAKDFEGVKKLLSDNDLEAVRKRLEDLGVPEELFGALLESLDTSFDSDKKATCKVYEQLHKNEKPLEEKDAGKAANCLRNRLKHWSPDQPKSFEVDAPAEAKYMLDRAIDNYYHLTCDETSAMRRFREQHVKDIPSMPPEGYPWQRPDE